MYNRQIEKLCRTRLDDVLLDEGLAERSHVEDAQSECEVTGRQLSRVLFDRDLLDEWDLAKLMARHYALPYMSLEDYTIPSEALTLLPVAFCRDHCLVPIEVFGEHVAIAVSELPAVPVLRELEGLLQTTPFVYVGLRSAIIRVIDEMDEDAYVPREAKVDATALTAAGRLDLPGITMRLGYSMHARSSAGSVPIQSLRSLPPRAAAPPTEEPKVVAAPADAESGDAGKSPAAWQEIFDLGGDG